MAAAKLRLLLLLPLFTVLLLHRPPGALATTFTLLNKCDYTVWPGLLSNAGVAQLSTTGFALNSGDSKAITLPANWGGRLWGRTLCATNATTGKFSCQTGDCGSGAVECAGGAEPPATLAEFTLDGSGGQDFYDVSLVDGYNLPMAVVPAGGSGANCSATGCLVDLNGSCPPQLRVTAADGGSSVACKSACGAFNEPQYCCSGAFGTPDTCKPSSYSEVFKNACPRAYSYAYDDKTSTFICAGSPDYSITFCPSPTTSQKATATGGQSSTSAGGQSSTSASPSTASSSSDSSMVYEGALEASSATWGHVTRGEIGVGVLTAIWYLLY